jgi:threonine dehydratase
VSVDGLEGDVPGREDIRLAAARIAPYVRHTPVLEVDAGTFGVEVPLALKLELLQVTGSFKPRGAFNRMLSAKVGEAGVVAASGGNFGLAVGHAARTLGHRAEIFVPSTSPAAKIGRVRATGAEVHVVEGYYDDASNAAIERQTETGAVWMHPFDQREVVAGQGTIGLELTDQVPEAGVVLVSIGGGGLIGGIASWFAGDARVIGVEPETSCSMAEALDRGEPTDVAVGGIAADSLGARRAGDIAFAVARDHVERVVLVSDDAIRGAQRAIWRELHMLAEPGGAAALAAVMKGGFRPASGERVVVVICGSNGDPSPVVDDRIEAAEPVG